MNPRFGQDHQPPASIELTVERAEATPAENRVEEPRTRNRNRAVAEMLEKTSGEQMRRARQHAELLVYLKTRESADRDRGPE